MQLKLTPGPGKAVEIEENLVKSKVVAITTYYNQLPKSICNAESKKGPLGGSKDNMWRRSIKPEKSLYLRPSSNPSWRSASDIRR